MTKANDKRRSEFIQLQKEMNQDLLDMVSAFEAEGMTIRNTVGASRNARTMYIVVENVTDTDWLTLVPHRFGYASELSIKVPGVWEIRVSYEKAGSPF